MKELKNLATHPFDSKSLTKIPNYIDFSAPLLGQGTLGCYAPSPHISILYISCKPSEEFVWSSNINNKKNDAFYFNYFLKAPNGLQALSEDRQTKRLMLNNTLLVDGTLSGGRSIVMVKNEIFEIFQLALSSSLLESLLNEYLADFSDKIKNFCNRKSRDRNQIGIILPIESREEMCIREITNCPLDINIQDEYTKLKVNELILYYFQRMVNGGVLEVSEDRKITANEKEKLIAVKTFLEENNKKDLDYKHVCELAEMNKQTLNEVFQRVFGHSITRYYRTQKMQSAYHMLLDLEKDMSVNEVAFELGFSSVSSFSRAFFNEFNIRPSGLRIK